MRGDELVGVLEASCRVSSSSAIADTLLPALSRVAGATFAFLHRTARDGGSTVVTWPPEADLMQRYQRDYVASCPFVPVKERSTKLVLPLSREVGRARLRRSPFHADLLRPADLEHHVELRLGAEGAPSSAGIMLCRGARAGEFEDAELAALSRLRPALATGVERALALEEAHGKIAALEALLSFSPPDALAVVVDRDDRVVFVSAPAGAWDERDLTDVRDARHPLRGLARDRLRGERGDGGSLHPLELRSSDGSALVGSVAIHGEPALAVLSLRRRSPSPPASESRLRARWGLTRAEAAVLGALVAGHDNRAIGQRLFISPETVRTHCTKIFRKLGVRSRLAAAALATRTLPRT